LFKPLDEKRIERCLDDQMCLLSWCKIYILSMKRGLKVSPTTHLNLKKF